MPFENAHIPVSLIAAMSTNRVIGRDNGMPWHLPEDLKYFKRVTSGKPVIMGRKTFESIGKPLPGRPNLVITRDRDWHAEGVTVFHSLEAALAAARELEPDEIIIGGGAEVYKLALPYTDKMYLTYIHKTIEGDTFFPDFDEADWQETAREDRVSDTGLAFSWLTLTRKVRIVSEEKH